MSVDAHTAAPSSGEPASPVGHEERDVTFRPIIWAGIGTAVVIVLVFGLVRWTFDSYFAREAAESPAANPLTSSYSRQLPPEPRLQTHPIQDLLALRAAEDAVLENYEWVDRPAGVVRIPIARAMGLLAERRLPTEPGTGGHP